MKPGIIYRGSLENTQVDYSDNSGNEQLVIVSIYDQETLIADDADPQIVPLSMSGDPVRISVIDNDEDKFTPIRSKQADIRVLTDNEIDITRFADGGDNRYYVEIAIGTTTEIIFKGFLSISDLRQEFQPHPNELLLVATDGLGFLKDIPLSDYDDENFIGENKIIEYIAGCLKKTGLDLDIICEMNIKEESFVTDEQDHFYDTIYLHALTFEESIGEFHDSYLALEKILGEDCYLCQQKGSWFIKRVDEYDTQDNKQAKFSSEGVFDEYLTDTAYRKTVGLQDMKFMNADAEVGVIRPNKSVEIEFKLETPLEVPANISFARGVGNDPDVTQSSQTIDYILSDWQYFREGNSGTYSDLDFLPVAGSFGVLRKIFEFGYIKESYLVSQSTDGRNYFKSQPIPVKLSDKISVGIDTRFSTDFSMTNMFPLHVQLVADNGDIYDWDYDAINDVNEWVPRTGASGWFLSAFRLDRSGLSTVEWINVSAESKPIPASGKIFIRLVNGFAAPTEIWFSNLSFTYIPFVNGTYFRYEAQKSIVSQSGDLKAIRKTQAYISDTDKLLFKGCLKKIGSWDEIFSGTITFASTGFSISGYHLGKFFIGQYLRFNSAGNPNVIKRVSAITYNIVGGTTAVTLEDSSFTVVTESGTIEEAVFVNTDFFYNAAVFPDGPPDDTYFHPFGYIQVFSVWNQLNRVMNLFEGTVDGLDTEKTDGLSRRDLPDLMHTFLMGDGHVTTYNRYFQLLHYEQDLYLCEWTGYFVEVFSLDIPKNYDGFEFKYISGND